MGHTILYYTYDPYHCKDEITIATTGQKYLESFLRGCPPL